MPAEALRVALGHADALVPLVNELIGKFKSGTVLIPRQQNLLHKGLHVLAAARRYEVWPAWLELLGEDEDDLDDLFGDHLMTRIVGITLSLVDEDVEPVVSLIEDQGVSPGVKWGLFQVLAWLTWKGRVPMERTRALLRRFLDEPLADEDDDAWEGWQDCVVLLGLSDMEDDLKAAWSKPALGFYNLADRTEALEGVRAASRDFADPQRFIIDHIMPFDDPVEALWWQKRLEQYQDEYEARSRRKKPRKSRDPAAGIWLDEDEQHWLSAFLQSRQVPDSTMSLEELDGFFCALVAGPELVKPSEAFPYVWGGDQPYEGAVFDSEEQASFVIDLLMRHWNSIAKRLAAGTAHEPFFYAADDGQEGRMWATGFMVGLMVSQYAWLPLIKDSEAGGTIAAILSLYKDNPDTLGEPVTPALRKQIVSDLPAIVLSIAHFWRKPSRHEAPPLARRNKVERNAPCPCGSGHKYKKCCGADPVQTLH